MKIAFWRVLLGAVLVSASTAVRADDPKVEEQDVAPVNQEAKYVVSPNGMHLAAVARKGSRLAVTVDGVTGPKFDEIITPTIGFIDPRGPTKEAEIAGTSNGNLYPPGPVTFSKDGKHFAYIGRQSNEWVVMADDKEVLRVPGGGIVGGTVGVGGSAGNT